MGQKNHEVDSHGIVVGSKRWHTFESPGTISILPTMGTTWHFALLCDRVVLEAAPVNRIPYTCAYLSIPKEWYVKANEGTMGTLGVTFAAASASWLIPPSSWGAFRSTALHDWWIGVDYLSHRNKQPRTYDIVEQLHRILTRIRNEAEQVI